MGSATTELRGVDLTRGVSIAEIKEDLPFAGHINGEAVVLVRDGEDVFAVGGTCTHYSAPLADGIVVKGEIRCPWHHACFSARTGEVVAAPAMNPLPRWPVEIRDGKVFVGEKIAPGDPLHPSSATSTNINNVVVIGGGAAGSSAAETLRREGYGGAITVIDPDVASPYDRPNLSKDYLAGNAPAEWLPLRGDDFYAQHGIRRITEAAESIDAAKKTVKLTSGATVSYDALILATGASPIRIPIPGVDLPHVHVLRTLADCESIIGDLKEAGRVIIAGASFIGMEAAASLRQRNISVTVVAPEEVPFVKVLGTEIGKWLQRVHEEHGVAFKLGRTLQRISDKSVTLDDGSDVVADVVLLGVGVKPRLELAQSAGLQIDAGVVVNEYLETSESGIYAVGDIARYPDPRSGELIRVEHWVVAQRQGAAAARNLLGKRKAFTSVPFFWTQQYDAALNYVGHAKTFTHIKMDGSPESGSCAVSFMNGDQLMAFVTVGRDRESLKVERELETWVT